MARSNVSIKHLQISKANAKMVAIVSGAVFVTIFCLMASRMLLSQRSYQARVISRKQKARTQLQNNIKTADSLVSSYKTFVAEDPNILSASKNGAGDNNGDNAKIVLDALPSKYDFPALATSLEKILTQYNFRILSITGTDDEITQQANATSSNPTVIEVPFAISVGGSFNSMKDLTKVLESSIRPFKIDSMEFTGTDNATTLNITAKTYYQPEKNLQIKMQVVK